MNSTPIRDYVLSRIRELKAERDGLSPEERKQRREEAIQQLDRDNEIGRAVRRAEADRIIRDHLRTKELDEAKQLVDNIRRNIVTCLKLEDWTAEDIETLMRNSKYARVYPETVTHDTEPLVVDMPRLSDVYIENISMDALESHFHGLPVPEPEPEPEPEPKRQEIELSLSDVYGSWKK
ncbi:hypothetical protein JXL21_05090 [Candidatus Bathyarchaeota archaeon]|nr:hypothetical protein [Candidatus Bathyarchaeota archaeon]